MWRHSRMTLDWRHVSVSPETYARREPRATQLQLSWKGNVHARYLTSSRRILAIGALTVSLFFPTSARALQAAEWSLSSAGSVCAMVAVVASPATEASAREFLIRHRQPNCRLTFLTIGTDRDSTLEMAAGNRWTGHPPTRALWASRRIPVRGAVLQLWNMDTVWAVVKASGTSGTRRGLLELSKKIWPDGQRRATSRFYGEKPAWKLTDGLCTYTSTA